MEKKQLPFEFDLLLSYPVVGRLQPVIVLEKAIKDLGKINDDNYEKFRYLQLELIVKKCELLSDIAGYINATRKFSPNETGVSKAENFLEVFKALVSNNGIPDFYKHVNDKNDQFFYEIMGYDILSLLPNSRHIVSEDELNKSVNVVKSIFQDMATFQDNYWKVYNAYKHGYRLFVNKAKCGPVKCHGEISGNLDLLTMDSITYVEGTDIKVISFSRDLAAYTLSPFYVFQGITNAFNARLINAFFGFYEYDLLTINSPLIRVFEHVGKYREIRLSFDFQSDDIKFKREF